MIGSQVSSYTLVAKLGSGPHGTVFRGVYVSDPSVAVAVKVWTPSERDDGEDLTALRAACAAVSGLEHSNITTLHELVVTPHQIATVHALLDGQDLASVLASGPLPIREVARILQSSLEALQYAHRQGTLHENIKPANLFRCRSSEIKLTDFSLIPFEDAPVDAQLHMLRYVPPERFSEGSSPAADVYAIGLVAWELLTGRSACPEGSPQQLQDWHQEAERIDVRSERPDCPEWMAALVATLSHPDPGQRPEDGGAALALLRSTMRYQPVILANLQANTRPVADIEVNPYPHQPPRMPDIAVPEPDQAPVPGPVRRSRLPRVLGTVLAASLLAGGGMVAWDTIEKSAAFRAATETNTAEGWASFIADWPAHPRQAEAQAALQDARLALLQAVYPMQPVEAGTYAIGCTPGQGDTCENAETLHDVTLTQAYLIGEAEVSQGLYASVTGTNPSLSADCGADCPVEQVSWFDAVAFANALSAQEGLTPCYAIDGEAVTMPSGLQCGGFRLPTEAEWEVAARGGQDLRFSGSDDSDAVGWFSGNSDGGPQRVRQKTPNGYGLYDMSGNVKEWVWDLHGGALAEAAPDGDDIRVSRGGSWIFGETLVSSRDGDSPQESFGNLGFRLIIPLLDAEDTPPPQETAP